MDQEEILTKRYFPHISIFAFHEFLQRLITTLHHHNFTHFEWEMFTREARHPYIECTLEKHINLKWNELTTPDVCMVVAIVLASAFEKACNSELNSGVPNVFEFIDIEVGRMHEESTFMDEIYFTFKELFNCF